MSIYFDNTILGISDMEKPTKDSDRVRLYIDVMHYFDVNINVLYEQKEFETDQIRDEFQSLSISNAICDGEHTSACNNQCYQS